MLRASYGASPATWRLRYRFRMVTLFREISLFGNANRKPRTYIMFRFDVDVDVDSRGNAEIKSQGERVSGHTIFGRIPISFFFLYYLLKLKWNKLLFILCIWNVYSVYSIWNVTRFSVFSEKSLLVNQEAAYYNVDTDVPQIQTRKST